MGQFDFLDQVQQNLQQHFAPNASLAQPNPDLPQQPMATGGVPSRAIPQMSLGTPPPQDPSALQQLLPQDQAQSAPAPEEDGLMQELIRLGTIQYLQNLVKTLKGGQASQ